MTEVTGMPNVKQQPGKKLIDVSADQTRTRIIISFAVANHGANFAHWLRNQLMLHYKLAGTTTVYLDSVACRDSGEIMKVYCVLNPAYNRASDPPCMKYLPEYFMVNPDFDKSQRPGPGNLWYIRDPKQNDKNPVPTLEKAKREGTPPIFVDPDTGKEDVIFSLIMPDMRPGDDELIGGDLGPDDERTRKKARGIGAMLQTWDGNFKGAMAQADVMIFCYTEEWRQSKPCDQEWNQFQQLNATRESAGKKPLRAVVLNFTSRDKPPTVNGPNITRLDVERKAQFIADRDDFVIPADDLVNLIKLIGPLS